MEGTVTVGKSRGYSRMKGKGFNRTSRYRIPAARVALTVWIGIVHIFLNTWPVIAKEPSLALSRRDKLFSCCFIDSQTGFAVGDKGMMLKTADRGGSWERVKVESCASLNAVTFVDGTGCVVGSNGTILRSDDRGKSWQQQESGTRETLMAIHLANSNRAVAVGSNGIILLTGDGGRTWERHPLDWAKKLPPSIIELCILSPNLYDIFFVDQQHGWVVGEKGTIMVTGDEGRNWDLISIGKYPSLYSVFFTNEREGVAVGKDGTLLTTVDGGMHWEHRAAPGLSREVDFNKICVDKHCLIIAGDRGTILRSRNSGMEWEHIPTGTGGPQPWLVGMCLIPENSPKEACIVGAGTIITVPLSK